jgi:hypothetical protein
MILWEIGIGVETWAAMPSRIETSAFATSDVGIPGNESALSDLFGPSLISKGGNVLAEVYWLQSV